MSCNAVKRNETLRRNETQWNAMQCKLIWEQCGNQNHRHRVFKIWRNAIKRNETPWGALKRSTVQTKNNLVIKITETPHGSESTVSAQQTLKGQEQNAYWTLTETNIPFFFQRLIHAQQVAKLQTDISYSKVCVAKKPTAYTTDNDEKRWASRWLH